MAASTTVPRSPLSPEQNLGDPSEPRRFLVDGLEVFARSTFESLPEQATKVEFSALILDEGDGPMACLSGVDGSYPPQCAGPSITGITMEPTWTETSAGTMWGERTFTVGWPPAGDTLQILDERPYDPPRRARPADRPVEASVDDIEAAHERLREMLDPNGPVVSIRAIPGQALTVGVLVPDLATIRPIAAGLGEPSLVRIFGVGSILG